ncbi:MAG: hypothetical protein M1838_005698 [Thelocarpon superellum]|nr:MAG: hypothetical protein M1838_005698 [Thelocarpon superellum]
MVSAAEDDFTNFLELGNFQLDFPAFDPATHPDHNGLDTAMDDAGDLTASIRKDGPTPQPSRAPTHQRHPASVSMMQPGHVSNEALLDMNMQAQAQAHFFQQQQRQQQQQQQQRMQERAYQPRSGVPPTPNSVEMHGGAIAYYHHLDAQSQAMVERYQRLKDDQTIFTPLVSPAVTPLEAQFAVPDYTVPGAYFSPLTSPALEAQQHVSQRPMYHHAPRSDTSATTSPVDMNFDLGPANPPSATSQPASSRKPRRRMSAPRTPARVVRQSPSMKPQRQKKPSSTVILPTELVEAAEPSSARGSGLNVPHSRDSSGTESISPEPLSEILMAPPPAPSAASTSAPSRSTSVRTGSSTGLHPATPASLMKLSNSSNHEADPATRSPASRPSRAGESMAAEQAMEDLTLPEAARGSHPQLSRVETQSTDRDLTPTSSAKRTPTVRPLNAPPTSVPGSANQSPSIHGLSSPLSTASGKKTEGKASGRVGKKRNSTNSVLVSPALRPKISPSIKPLLPDGALVSAETSALLLASKSNYQNILEGNHLPGVSYPEALSTNLTSKRTSHKIAEQGRRNRINNALQEIASLLPSSSQRDSSSSGGEANAPALTTAAQQSNSKASTVEMAIDYIKSLQAELAETKGKLAVVEKKLVEQD